MSDNYIFIATYIDIKRSLTVEGVVLLGSYREASLREPGIESMDAFQETSRTNRFVIIESWKDQSAFEAHERAEPAVQFRARLDAIHSSPCDQRLHKTFAIGRESEVTANALCVVTHVDVPPPRKDEAEVLLRRLAGESRGQLGCGVRD